MDYKKQQNELTNLVSLNKNACCFNKTKFQHNRIEKINNRKLN